MSFREELINGYQTNTIQHKSDYDETLRIEKEGASIISILSPENISTDNTKKIREFLHHIEQWKLKGFNKKEYYYEKPRFC